MRIQSSRLKGCGKFRRMRFAVRVYAAASHHERADTHPFFYEESPGTLRPHQTFMTSETQDRNAHFLHVNGQHAGRLRSVHHQTEPVPTTNFSYTDKVQYISCEIRSMGTDDSPGGWPDIFFEIVIINISSGICRDYGQRDAPGFHEIQWPQHRIMFQSSGNDMIAGSK